MDGGRGSEKAVGDQSARPVQRRIDSWKGVGARGQKVRPIYVNGEEKTLRDVVVEDGPDP